MRSLGVLLWCALFIGQSNAQPPPPPPCNWQIPEAVPKCEQIIKWKVYSHEQATATCLEYFPTTFVDGKMSGDQVKCTVYRQFQCDFQPNSFSIFDKCYYFDTIDEVKLADYLDETTPADAPPKCPGGGKLPIFFSMSQAKHIAKRANKKGIAKMWVNLNREGKLIEDSQFGDKKFMLHKNLWKVHKDSWWNGDKLEKSPPGPDGPDVPQTAQNLFFRTDTDYVLNLWQGQFELATQKAKATVVCEYTAKIVPDQERYCKKMGIEGLGLKTVYDTNTKTGRKRCLFNSLSKYPMKGTKEAIQNFPGCKETPSNEHVAGLDDGTASKSAYDQLTQSGTYRVAAIKMDMKTRNRPGGEKWWGETREKKDCKTATFQENHRQPYLIFDKFMKQQFCGIMSSSWEAGYPRNECSDFPDGEMDSNTLAIKNTKIIDVPVPVKFKAICSIETNLDCELNANPKLCRDDQKCTNVGNWNTATGKYAECSCVKFHTDNGGKCEWSQDAAFCAMVLDWPYENITPDWKEVKNIPLSVPKEKSNQYISLPNKSHQEKFRTYKAVVRYKCTLTVWSHDRGTFALLNDVGYGEYDVPNSKAGTFNGDTVRMDAETADCFCQ